MSSKKTLVIGTTLSSEKPGGIPSYFQRQIDGEIGGFNEYTTFAAFGELDEKKFISLGRMSENKYLRFIRSQYLLLKNSSKFDFIHVHSVRTGLFALLFHRKKVTFYYHGPGFQEAAVEGVSSMKIWMLFTIEHILIRRIDSFVTLTKSFKKRLCENHGVRDENIRTEPPKICIDSNLIDGVRRKFRTIGDRPLRFVIVRRLVNRVGVVEFLKKYKEHQELDCEINVVGEGPLSDNIASLCENDSRVTFHGKLAQSDLNELMKVCDGQIVPTKHLEGFGMVLIESLENNLIPICTDCDGMGEVVKEIGCGIVSSDIDSLFEYMNKDAMESFIHRLKPTV